MKFDKIDKDILYYMDLEIPFRYSNIAKKIKKSKSFVEFRTKRMLDNEVILEFFPIFDVGKMGFFVYDLYILTKGNSEQEKLIIDYFKNNKLTNCIELVVGAYNLYISFFVKNMYDFENLMIKFTSKFENIILKYDVELISRNYTCAHNYLGYKKPILTHNPNYELKTDVEINEKEKRLIKVLADDPTRTYVDLAKETSMNVKTVISYMKQLLEKRIIYAIRPSVNSNKLGYITKHMIVSLRRRMYHKKEEVIKYFLEHNSTMFISSYLNRSGFSTEVVFKNIEEERAFERNLISKFSDCIKETTYLDKYKEIMYTYLPSEF